MKRLLLLAGEESGILYANRIAAKVRERFPEVEIRGYHDYGFETGDLAVFGYFAVLKRIFFFLRVKRTMERAMDEWRPDAVCTVDYPGMNLKLAAYAKQKGIRAVHVVCPQVWAWHQGRIPKIEASLDKLCCFFPFEPKVFKPGFAEFVGHPLAENEVEGGRLKVEQWNAQPVVAILPGSRLGEIEKILPTLLEAAGIIAKKFPDVSFVIPAANAKARNAIAMRLKVEGWRLNGGRVTLIDGGARKLLERATCAVVASGTATLEAALARCPTVLVYRVGAVTAMIARRVIKGIRHVGLANIVAEKAGAECPMPELLQENFTVPSVVAHLEKWLNDESARAEAVEKLDHTMALLKGGNDPIGRIAEIVEGK